MTKLSEIHRSIIHIALPMMVASCSIPLLGLVDTAILGHLDHARYLATVAAGGSIMTFIGWLFAFLRMGNSGLTAQALGQGNTSRNQELALQSVGLGCGFGLLLMAVHQPLLQFSVSLMTPSAEIKQLTYQYCQIRIMAAPATLVTSALLGWLLGNSRARDCVTILLATNVTNIVLDYVLIMGFQLNSAGAAWASFAAEWLGLGVALLLAARIYQRLQGNSPALTLFTKATFSIEQLAPLLKVNKHLFFRTCCVVFSMAFFYAQGARQGETVLAANAILIQLLLLIAYSQDGFASAAEALTGKALGANKLDAFYHICRLVIYWGFLLATAATVILAAWPEAIIGIFTSIPDVYATARQYWPWLVALPLASAFCFMADGIFIGGNKSRDMLHTMLIATLCVFLPCWHFSQPMGNHGLWLAYLSFLLSRSLLMAVVFFRHTRRNSWIKPHEATL